MTRLADAASRPALRTAAVAAFAPSRRAALALIAGAGAAALSARPAAAGEDPVYSDWRGRAIKGYDPVAYFTEGRPVAGDSDITYSWNGAEWRFASEANRALFIADPAAYAPQYGGYCAWAVSHGQTASIDPEAWDIVDGKLYLNYSKSVQKQWKEDRPAAISRADANWPALLD
ncbi:YHS domain-containing (seleno)protein [Rhodovulum sp. DZ06]|uniref:YHS domain-containing (seleno)protein n=1 Tax=Rhodovulum sp. DZ06 TaxID=3425126 RepID=UPI003D350C83